MARAKLVGEEGNAGEPGDALPGGVVEDEAEGIETEEDWNLRKERRAQVPIADDRTSG